MTWRESYVRFVIISGLLPNVSLLRGDKVKWLLKVKVASSILEQ